MTEAGTPLRIFGIQVVSVQGTDMEPALSQGDAALVDAASTQEIAVEEIVA